MREIGLQPQVLICRTENPLDRDVRQKLSMFCSVSEKAVIEARDVEHTVYEYPLMLHAEGLDELVCDLLHLKTPEPDLANWRKFVERVVSPKKRVKIAVVGKYIDLQDAYKSIYESLTHAAASQDCGIDLKLIDAESLQDGVDGQLKDVAGVLIPGGFGERGVEGKIKAARFAREHKVPYLGLCLGMQVATIEFARNVCGIENANSTEFDKDAPEPVISLLEEQRGVRNKGASMRLGTWPTKIASGTLAEKIYGSDEVLERHRHRYEFNMKYRDRMTEKGFHDLGNITRRHARGADRVARSSVFRRLPVSSRVSKQAEQTTSALQRIYSGLSRASSGRCAARRNRSIIAAPSP